MERVEIAWLRLLKSFLERRGSVDIPALANTSLAQFEQLKELLNETVDSRSRSLHELRPAVIRGSGLYRKAESILRQPGSFNPAPEQNPQETRKTVNEHG